MDPRGRDSDAEVEHLIRLGKDTVIMGEREIARGIMEVVMNDFSAAEAEPGPVEQGREGVSHTHDPSAPRSELRQRPA